MIYFITQHDRYVKIGYTRLDPYGRLKALQGSNPEELKLYCVIEGDRKKEQELHERFRDLLVRGEWYYMTDKIRSYLNILKRNKNITAMSLECLRSQIIILDDLRRVI